MEWDSEIRWTEQQRGSVEGMDRCVRRPVAWLCASLLVRLGFGWIRSLFFPASHSNGGEADEHRRRRLLPAGDERRSFRLRLVDLLRRLPTPGGGLGFRLESLEQEALRLVERVRRLVVQVVRQSRLDRLQLDQELIRAGEVAHWRRRSDRRQHRENDKVSRQALKERAHPPPASLMSAAA